MFVANVATDLHRIVNEAIRTKSPGDDQAEGLTFDLSRIDFDKLRDPTKPGSTTQRCWIESEFAEVILRRLDSLQECGVSFDSGR